MVLTDKQRQDLHQSMLDYLVGMGERFADTAATFEREADIRHSVDGKHAGLLERKWTSVLRLQKKVMDLETRLQQLEEQAKLGNIVSRREILGTANGVRAEYLPIAPRKYELTGHRSPITCVVFHPVFSVLVSGSEDATIKVWDFESGDFERTLKGHTHSVQSAVFDKTGSVLASSSSDLTIKLWNFSAEGDYECIKTLRGHDHNVCSVLFDPVQTERLISCSRDQLVKIWDTSTGYCTHTLSGGHTEWVRDIAISDDGRLLASCGNDRCIVIWDMQSFRVIHTLREHEHVVESVVFATAGSEAKGVQKALAAGRYMVATPSIHESSTSNGVSANTIETAKKYQYLLSGSRDRTVRLWDAVTGSLLRTFTQHENWVRMVRFHSSGKFAISAAEDKSIRVFDLENGRCVRTISDAHEHFVTCIDVHPTLPMVISGGIDKSINIWDCM